jgi:hypothetical protein
MQSASLVAIVVYSHKDIISPQHIPNFGPTFSQMHHTLTAYEGAQTLCTSNMDVGCNRQGLAASTILTYDTTTASFAFGRLPQNFQTLVPTPNLHRYK